MVPLQPASVYARLGLRDHRVGSQSHRNQCLFPQTLGILGFFYLGLQVCEWVQPLPLLDAVHTDPSRAWETILGSGPFSCPRAHSLCCPPPARPSCQIPSLAFNFETKSLTTGDLPGSSLNHSTQNKARQNTKQEVVYHLSPLHRHTDTHTRTHSVSKQNPLQMESYSLPMYKGLVQTHVL